MINYISTRGGTPPVGFDRAVLDGFAPDGGLYVPEAIPVFSNADLQSMAHLDYPELASRVIRGFISAELILDRDLRDLLGSSFRSFETEDVTRSVYLSNTDLHILELYHGPTLSFKDIAMGFLINCLDYFLTRSDEKVSLILATTGDTGPAAAHAAAGKKTLECWPLYPRDMISDEQERQMTTLNAANVHPVGVEGCKNGGDDLDIIVAGLFGDAELKKALNLSSVNSINWCRIMVQTVHYFSAYFKAVGSVGEEIVVSVPTGAFGNLCAGFIARTMGLPLTTFICATNANGTLHRLFSAGTLSKKTLKQTVSSAIDIVVPYNFWRFLYFVSNRHPDLIKECMATFESDGEITFAEDLYRRLRNGFSSCSISDSHTLATIQSIYSGDDAYLLDPHGAVAAAAALSYRQTTGDDRKIISLATAHPAKFPQVIQRALGGTEYLPPKATHPSIEAAKNKIQHLRICRYEKLAQTLPAAMRERLAI